MESIIATFHLDWKLVLAQLVNFALVVFVLWFFVLKPLTKVMGERSQEIEKSLIQTKEIEEKFKEAEKERAEILKESRRQAQKIIAQAKILADSEREKIIESARLKVEKIVEDSKTNLAFQKKQVLAEIHQYLADLVVGACEKILPSVMDKKIDHALADKVLAEVEKQDWQNKKLWKFPANNMPKVYIRR